jgi:replicative DNA helicase
MSDLKALPHSKELEESVLGAIMMEPGCLPLVVSRLHEAVFYHELHRRAYRAIMSLYDQSQPADLVTVTERMNRLGLFDKSVTPYDLTLITNAVVSSANIEAHILILQQYYLQREAIRLGNEMVFNGYNADPFDTLNSVGAEILRLQEQALKGHNKTMADHIIQVNKDREAISLKGTLGTPTGLTTLDEVISGLVPPDLIILAARPGMGKTALALTIIRYVAIDRKEPAGLFSLEMSAAQVVTRLESIQSGIAHEYVRKNDLSESQRIHLANADAILAKSGIHIDDHAGLNIRELRTAANIMKRKHGIKHLVVDYLQLMSGVDERGKSRENVISEISRGLKVIAKELDITVIALSQLSREVEKRPDKMPQLSDLRESGSIEQDADEVIFLMRPEYYEMIGPVEIGGQEYDSKDLVICKVAKNRHGSPKGIPLYFNAPCMTFMDRPPGTSFKPIKLQNYYETEKVEDEPF